MEGVVYEAQNRKGVSKQFTQKKKKDSKATWA